jgi:hypothetical protein
MGYNFVLLVCENLLRGCVLLVLMYIGVIDTFFSIALQLLSAVKMMESHVAKINKAGMTSGGTPDHHHYHRSQSGGTDGGGAN